MTDDLRIRVDRFFSAPKSLVGSWCWYLSEYVNVYKFRREIAEDGVVSGFRLEAQALVDTDPREFRFLILGLDRCVFRLDCAPKTDDTHYNDPKRPFGFPHEVRGCHYHPWDANRHRSTRSAISDKLPYALESKDKIATIQQGFWQLCTLANISAIAADVPDWPERRLLI